MDINRAVMMATDCMNYHGLHARGWRFELDNAQRRMGVCKLWKRIISISKPSALLNSENEVLDTILHEIAHALAPEGAHHGWQWKMKAREIGAKPERCAGKETVPVPSDWTAHCSDCPVVVHRSRRPNDRMMRTAFHTKCRYKANHGLLTWKHKGVVVAATQYRGSNPYQPSVPYGTVDATAAIV
jgi:predicted SprT family Zn-dependent metalloprotease